MTRPDLQAVLAQLRARFVGTAASIVATFDDIADRLDANPTDVTALEPLVRESHRVHGTAGSHGFHEASRLAGELQRSARGWMADSSADPAVHSAADSGADSVLDRGATVRAFARALERALRDPGEGQP